MLSLLSTQHSQQNQQKRAYLCQIDNGLAQGRRHPRVVVVVVVVVVVLSIVADVFVIAVGAVPTAVISFIVVVVAVVICQCAQSLICLFVCLVDHIHYVSMLRLFEQANSKS